jgi:hypothetical protein
MQLRNSLLTIAAVFSGNTMTVNLTGVADVQQITLTLTSVTGSGGQLLGSAAASLNLLVGDAIASKLVERADVTERAASNLSRS